MTPKEFLVMKAAEKAAVMSAMTDGELEQLRLACWADAKQAEGETGAISSKLRNAASLVAMVQTQRKYA